MTKHLNLTAIAAVSLGLSSLALAQQGGIGTIKIEPSPAKAGQEVKITVSAEGEVPTFCGMVVSFGDGSEPRNIKIASNESKFPVVIAKTFAGPGTYSVRAEGKKVTTHFPCNGKTEAKLTVEALPASAAPPAKPDVKAAAPACPEGYSMSGKPGKSGDFTCKANKGAKRPAQAPACAEGLEYFEKGSTLGCARVKPKAKK
jgi:hypothetical protein